MDVFFDTGDMSFGDDFNTNMGLDGFISSSQNFIDSVGIQSLMQAISGIESNPMLGEQMIGYSQIGDWNGDGIWDVEQDIFSIPGALGQWLYGVALVEAGIDPLTGSVFDSTAYISHLIETTDEGETELVTVNIDGVLLTVPFYEDDPNTWDPETITIAPIE